MQIRIEQIRSSKEGYEVLARYADGTLWMGWHDAPPVLQKEYDVELAFGGVLRWGHEIVLASDAAAAGDSSAIRGTFEEIIEEGRSVLRVADGIVLVETAGQAPPLGSSVLIVRQRAIAFPVDL